MKKLLTVIILLLLIPVNTNHTPSIQDQNTEDSFNDPKYDDSIQSSHHLSDHTINGVQSVGESSTTSGSWQNVTLDTNNMTITYNSGVMIYATIEMWSSASDVGHWRIVLDNSIAYNITRSVDVNHGNLMMNDVFINIPVGEHYYYIQHYVEGGSTLTTRAIVSVLFMSGEYGGLPISKSFVREFVSSDDSGWITIPASLQTVACDRPSRFAVTMVLSASMDSNNAQARFRLLVDGVPQETTTRSFKTANSKGAITLVGLSDELPIGVWNISAEFELITSDELTINDLQIISVGSERNYLTGVLPMHKGVVQEVTTTSNELVNIMQFDVYVEENAKILVLGSGAFMMSSTGTIHAGFVFNGTDNELVRRDFDGVKRNGSIGMAVISPEVYHSEVVNIAGQWNVSAGTGTLRDAVIVVIVLHVGDRVDSATDPVDHMNGIDIGTHENFNYSMHPVSDGKYMTLNETLSDGQYKFSKTMVWEYADYRRNTNSLRIYVTNNSAENLELFEYDVTGLNLISLGNLSAGWNNITIHIFTPTYSLVVNDTNQVSDAVQDSWDIDVAMLYTYDSSPPIFVSVYTPTALVTSTVGVTFFAHVYDIDNPTTQIVVRLYYSNDSFVADNHTVVLSYTSNVTTNTYRYQYEFAGQSTGTELDFYYTAYDGNVTTIEPSVDFYNIQWGLIVGASGGGSGQRGGSSFGFAGNIRLDISVFYQFSNVPNARIEIQIFKDFFKEVKLASFQTYTDSSGVATINVVAEDGDWIEIHVYATWQGDVKEAEIQKRVNNIDTTYSITINLYTGFLGFDNSLVREYVKAFLITSLFLVLLLVAYIYWRRNYRKTGLIKNIVVSTRTKELYQQPPSSRFIRAKKTKKLKL